MFKRIVCCTLSMVMILLTVTALPAWAADSESSAAIPENEAEIFQSEAALASSVATPAVNVNITDGSIRVAVGAHCRLVHDDYEVRYISAFGGVMTVTGGDTVLANTVGTTSLSVCCYPAGATTPTYINLEVIICDAEGMIDLTLGNTFVEKGKSYIVNFDGYEAVMLSSPNGSIVSITSNYMITANQTGSFNVWGQYYNAEGQASLRGAMIDVFEGADIFGNFFWIKPKGRSYYVSTTYDNNVPFLNIEGTHSRYPGDTSTWRFILRDDGYYAITTPTMAWGLGVVTDASTGALSIGMVPVGTMQDMDADHAGWKILEDAQGKLLLAPKCTIGSKLALSMIRTNSGRSLILTDYYGTTYGSILGLGWEIHDTAVYIDNYYDASVSSAIRQSWIPEANEFVSVGFWNTFLIDVVPANSLTYFAQCPADSPDCKDDKDQPCDAECGTECGSHHKNVYNILDTLADNSSVEAGHTRFLWTDRAYGAYCVGNDTMDGWLAVNQGNRAMYFTMTIAGETAAVRDARLGIMMMHEISHAFGMYEAYDVTGHDQGDAYICVMERYESDEVVDFYDDILRGVGASAYCESCLDAMEECVYDAYFAAEAAG